MYSAVPVIHSKYCKMSRPQCGVIPLLTVVPMCREQCSQCTHVCCVSELLPISVSTQRVALLIRVHYTQHIGLLYSNKIAVTKMGYLTIPFQDSQGKRG